MEVLQKYYFWSKLSNQIKMTSYLNINVRLGRIRYILKHKCIVLLNNIVCVGIELESTDADME